MQTSKPRARKGRRAALALGAALVLVLGDYLLYPLWCPVGGRSLNRGRNGLWLRYWWYTGERGEAEAKRVAESLADRQVRYAFFHVRHVEADGRLHVHSPLTARRLVGLLHRTAPDVRAIAWVYAGNARGRGGVDLSRRDVRRRMVAEAVWLVKDCGFDGVQWDYEVCESGDRGLLALLDETRAALPHGKLLSVAAPVWAPWPLPRMGLGWSGSYFAQVAERGDQIAVMCYDTGLYPPRLYVWLVRQQAIRVTRVVGGSRGHCRILLGLPTYGKGGLPHHPWAENLRLALKGACEGLAHRRADPSAFEGVALFADYTTDEEEWGVYQSLWLEQARSGERR